MKKDKYYAVDETVDNSIVTEGNGHDCCFLCKFKDYTMEQCASIKCTPSVRKDKMWVYFKPIEENKS